MTIKDEIKKVIMELHKEKQLTILSITHDIDEAILLSDRIYILTGKPGTITKEVVIKEPKPRRKDFNLTEEFLEYKKEIILHLEEE